MKEETSESLVYVISSFPLCLGAVSSVISTKVPRGVAKTGVE